MPKLKAIFAAIAVVVAHSVWPALADTPATTDLSDVLVRQGVDPARAALLVVRLDDGAQWAAGGRRIDTRFPPASTSKIPHTLIALETGIADGADTMFPWDGVERWSKAWNQDQTMTTAFRRSAVWVYQQIATRAGRDTMAGWLARFDYGNGDVGGPDDLTRYWLVGPLEISAREQTAFLARLATRRLPLSQRTYAIADQIMRADGGDGWSLYAKTGWRHDGVTTDIGWYVGWLVARGRTYCFAFNMDMPTPEQDRAKRTAVVRTALTAIGALPDPTMARQRPEKP